MNNNNFDIEAMLGIRKPNDKDDKVRIIDDTATKVKTETVRVIDDSKKEVAVDSFQIDEKARDSSRQEVLDKANEHFDTKFDFSDNLENKLEDLNKENAPKTTKPKLNLNEAVGQKVEVEHLCPTGRKKKEETHYHLFTVSYLTDEMIELNTEDYCDLITANEYPKVRKGRAGFVENR